MWLRRVRVVPEDPPVLFPPCPEIDSSFFWSREAGLLLFCFREEILPHRPHPENSQACEELSISCSHRPPLSCRPPLRPEPIPRHWWTTPPLRHADSGRRFPEDLRRSIRLLENMFTCVSVWRANDRVFHSCPGASTSNTKHFKHTPVDHIHRSVLTNSSSKGQAWTRPRQALRRAPRLDPAFGIRL